MALSTEKYVIALDPGLVGAGVLVCYAPKWRVAHTNEWDCRGKRKRKLVTTVIATMGYLAQYVEEPPPVVIENVFAGRNAGPTSMLNFGKAVGALEASVAGLGLSLERVQPSLWKRHLGLPADKRYALVRAAPLLGVPKLRRKDEHLAEATLIAFWYALRAAKRELSPGSKDYGLLS